MVFLNAYDLLIEITKHYSFNPQPEVLEEFANRLMINKDVRLIDKNANVEDTAYSIADVNSETDLIQ